MNWNEPILTKGDIWEMYQDDIINALGDTSDDEDEMIINAIEAEIYDAIYNHVEKYEILKEVFVLIDNRRQSGIDNRAEEQRMNIKDDWHY